MQAALLLTLIACTHALHPTTQFPRSNVRSFGIMHAVNRRNFLGAATLTTVTPIVANAGYLDTIEFRGMDTGDANSNLPSFKSLPSGVQFFDIVEGSGEEAKEGKSVTLQWVLRDSRGYFVESSKGSEPFIYRVGNLKAAIAGFDEGIRGMKVGGRRRITVPAGSAYKETGDGKPGPMPDGFGPRRQIDSRKARETWNFEVELKKMR